MIKYHEKDYGSTVVNNFRDYLWGDKKVEEATIDAYCIAVRAFCKYSKIYNENGVKSITGVAVRNFVEYLKDVEYVKGKKYSVSSINIKIVGVNQFLEFNKLANLKARLLEKQRRLFINDAEMLTDMELSKFLCEAKNEAEDIYNEFRAIVQTGIRASEVRFITYESLQNGYIDIYNKGTSRQVPLPTDLRLELQNMCKRKDVISGSIFNGKSGNPLNRSEIARQMKKIGIKCGISTKKLHPHNLRHFFALKFIAVYGEDTLSVLADILGHKSIETTRIYLKQSLSKLSEKMTLKELKIAS